MYNKRVMFPNFEKNRAEFNPSEMALGFPDQLPLTLNSLHAMEEKASELNQQAQHQMAEEDTLDHAAMRGNIDNASKNQARQLVIGAFRAAIIDKFGSELDTFNLDNERPGLGQ